MRNLCLGLLALSLCGTSPNAGPYRSPFDLAFSPDGKLLAVSDATAGTLSLIDVAAGKVARQVALNGEPRGVVWVKNLVYAAEYGAGTVAEIDAATGRVVRRLATGPRPVGLATAPKAGLLLAANTNLHSVSILDLKTGKERGRVRVPREPFAIAVCPDEKLAVVTNLLPAGRATDPGQAAVVSLINLATSSAAGDIRLPSGSSSVREVAINPSGRWAYVAHNVGRTNLPTTQLDRGWINTNAFSILDLPAKKVYATLLLDHPMEGAANPWGVALSGDAKALWVSISGVHRLAKIDLETLHAFLEGKLPDKHRLSQTAKYGPGNENVWLRIKRDPKERADLVNDLAALTSAGLIHRIKLSGNGPRGIDLSPDGKLAAAAVYFSGHAALVDTAEGRVKSVLPLGPSPEPDLARKGRIIFHDATYCFQSWLSCATCHPNDGRVDGMNWDLLNDGIGNPKNAKSLLLSDRTPPMMWRGVREKMSEAVKKGFFFQLRVPGSGEAEAVEAYLQSLKPEPSPRLLPGGKLSPAAERGRALFMSPKTKCAQCHTGELFTDLKQHAVGTRGEFDKADVFDTPTLVEAYRTAPYLHDGSAKDMQEVLTKRNSKDLHGATSHLSEQELKDLIEYLLSL